MSNLQQHIDNIRNIEMDESWMDDIATGFTVRELMRYGTVFGIVPVKINPPAGVHRRIWKPETRKNRLDIRRSNNPLE